MNSIHRSLAQNLYMVAGRVYRPDAVTEGTFLLRDILDNHRLSIKLADVQAMIEHHDLVPLKVSNRQCARQVVGVEVVVDACTHRDQSTRQLSPDALPAGTRHPVLIVLHSHITRTSPPHKRAHEPREYPPLGVLEAISLLSFIHQVQRGHNPISSRCSGNAGASSLTAPTTTHGIRAKGNSRKKVGRAAATSEELDRPLYPEKRPPALHKSFL
ncbi:hypothetical protein V466_25700 [Pseudomonas mandelii PD30]|uniref:Uncharacterized protein n=1 Tax=Pseudomonas mandelii PD30 TaxID=1419583 RepID=A0A059KWI5_9PSED|nr:hypothetical protein V466_25700 [Pseudomonas mandelii PD30]